MRGTMRALICSFLASGIGAKEATRVASASVPVALWGVGEEAQRARRWFLKLMAMAWQMLVDGGLGGSRRRPWAWAGRSAAS
ncbi:hypothetical protein NL676_009518 [Syzygium grande]|nr:hypothetical protein NL676_009518 [Syzygium grande]